MTGPGHPRAGGGPAIRLREVEARYGARRAVYIPALEVPTGTVLAVLGPSGAGKTTLLRVINGLVAPAGGTLELFGRPVGPAGPDLATRRRMTLVFQVPVLFSASVRHNVAYGLAVRGVRDGRIARRVERALALVGLPGLGDRPARQLSAGEAQRVALARALVTDPEILLLDEPTANLDPHSAAAIEALVRRVNAERGTTVVLVTHSPAQARRLAHAACVLLDGRLVEHGPVDAVLERPRDPAARAFLRGEVVF